MNFNSHKNFPATWQLKSVNDVCLKVTSGGTPSRTEPDFYVNGTWPWVKTKELADGWLHTTEEFITEEAVAKSSAKVLPAKTVLMAMYGATVGQLGILREPMTCNQACCAMIVDEQKADFRYLYYLLLLHREQIRSIASGAAQQNLSGQQIKQLVFAFPPLDEQRCIAHILGTLDDKIELNRGQNETLESLARALFQSWFVDFDPVQAKANGESEAAICQRLGLTPQVLALFPAALEESVLGEVPVGWEVKQLPELVEINPTRSLKRAAVAPYLDMANVPAYSARINNVVERAFGSGTKFINGDTLLARITPCLENGKTAYVDFLQEKQVGWGSTEFIVLRPKAPLPTEFGYLLARHEAFRAFAIAHMEGTSGRQRVPANCFNNYFMAKPSKAVAELFSKTVKPLMHQIKQQDEESRTLAGLRDELLPKLLLGKIMPTNI